MTTPLTAGEVDAALDGHGAACDRMAERLVLLDGHHGQRLLDGATLTPANRGRWTAAKATLADVWACFEAYRDALAAARELRARRPRPAADDLARFTALLRDRHVVLLAEPAGAPGAPAAGPARLSLDELAARMEAGYAQVSSLVAEAVAGWTALAARLDPLAAAATAASEAAAELGQACGAEPAELAEVAAELAALRGTDPLAAAALPAAAPGEPGGVRGAAGGAGGESGGRDGEVGAGPVDRRVDAVAARLRDVTGRLAAAQQLRDGYPQRRAALLARLAELDRARCAAVALAETVRAKIAAVAPEPALDASRVRAGLAGLDGCHARGEWLVMAERFAELDGQVSEAATGVAAAAERLGELLDRRAELRGRLDAYRAKAGQLGHAEDGTLAGLYRAAHELLWAAPCDLAAATRAVAGYQGEVNKIVHGERGALPGAWHH